jgi:hypothetical protein
MWLLPVAFQFISGHIIFFLMVLPHIIQTLGISSTAAVIRMILVWLPSGTLQFHMAEFHVMGLGELRLARKANLQNLSDEQIVTPRQL